MYEIDFSMPDSEIVVQDNFTSSRNRERHDLTINLPINYIGDLRKFIEDYDAELVILGDKDLRPNKINITDSDGSIISKTKLMQGTLLTDRKNEHSTGQAPWYQGRPKGRVQAALAPNLPCLDALYNAL